MLSSFESRLLDRHLRGCPSCRAFAAAAASQTELLRAAPLEVPAERFALPPAPARRVGRRAVAAAVASLAAASVAAVSLFLTGGGQHSSTISASRLAAASGPMLVVVPAHPSPAEKEIDVPRMQVKPVSLVDEPIHGLYDEPA